MLSTICAEHLHNMCGASARHFKRGEKASFFYVIIHYKALFIYPQEDRFNAQRIDFIYKNSLMQRVIV